MKHILFFILLFGISNGQDFQDLSANKIPGLVEDIGSAIVMVFAQGSIGVFGDRLNKRLLIVICMMGHPIALLFLTFAKSAGMVVIFAVLHGLSWGFSGPLMTSIRADYFGRGSFATIMGWSSLIIQIGTTTGPLIGAGIGDAVGTYSPAFGVFAGFTLLGAFFLRRQNHQSLLKTLVFRNKFSFQAYSV